MKKDFTGFRKFDIPFEDLRSASPPKLADALEKFTTEVVPVLEDGDAMDYDLSLLAAMAVIAYGDGSAPKPGIYIATTICGALVFMAKNRIIPTSISHEPYIIYNVLWALTLECLEEIDAPASIKLSICRLMCAEHHRGDQFTDGSSGNKAYEYWTIFEYCPGYCSTNNLKLSVYIRGSDLGWCTQEETEFLERFGKGAKLMAQKILTEEMSKYHW